MATAIVTSRGGDALFASSTLGVIFLQFATDQRCLRAGPSFALACPHAPNPAGSLGEIRRNFPLPTAAQNRMAESINADISPALGIRSHDRPTRDAELRRLTARASNSLF